jgi:hypothetical protein
MNVIKTLANKASTDLSAYEGHAVKFDTDGINICSAITDQPVGVVTKAGAEFCDVCVLGECKAIAGAAITAGKMVIPHTDGKVKNTAASSQEFALALETGVAGDWVSVFVLGATKTQS